LLGVVVAGTVYVACTSFDAAPLPHDRFDAKADDAGSTAPQLDASADADATLTIPVSRNWMSPNGARW
jgi:hypothetical protein